MTRTRIEMNAMANQNPIESPECQNTRALLSDYMENTLSGRAAWSVEKHLTACALCARYLREMQTTVSLLQTMPRRDTSDDFMARLHARLDTVEPQAESSLARLTGWRERLADCGAALRGPRVPALSLSLSAVALAAALAVNQWMPGARPSDTLPASKSAAVPAASAQTLNHHVALSASSPFDDPAAANLESQPADGIDSGNENENSGS